MLTVLFILFTIGFWPHLARAIQILPPCTATGNCQLCDFVLGFMNIMRWGFGVVGAVAILFIIIAGIGWVTSQGQADKIKKAKNRVVAIVIGLTIMLLSWQITNFIVATFTLSNAPGTIASKQTKPSLFSNNSTIWYNICSGNPNQPCAGKGDGSPCRNGAGYCLTDPITRKSECKEEGISTCTFLATDVNFKKYYSEYSCRPKSECDFNRDLGSGYCDDSTNTNCCAPSTINN